MYRIFLFLAHAPPPRARASLCDLNRIEYSNQPVPVQYKTARASLYDINQEWNIHTNPYQPSATS